MNEAFSTVMTLEALS